MCTRRTREDSLERELYADDVRAKEVAVDFVEEILSKWHPEESLAALTREVDLGDVERTKDFLNGVVFRAEAEVNGRGEVTSIKDCTDKLENTNRRRCFGGLFVGWSGLDREDKLDSLVEFAKNEIRQYFRCMVRNTTASTSDKLAYIGLQFTVKNLNKIFLRGSTIQLVYTGYVLTILVDGAERLAYRHSKD